MDRPDVRSRGTGDGNWGRAAFRTALLLHACAWVPFAAAAQEGDRVSARERLEADLRLAKRDHLRRVALWGGGNLLAGAGIAGPADPAVAPFRRGFGLQTAAWGAINTGIAVVGLRSGSGPDPMEAARGGGEGPGLAAALEAEEAWARILLLNLGLNAGYVLVGTALAIAAGHGLRSPDAVRGHALAVVTQGAGLLVLDGVAWIASERRLEALRALVAALEAGGVGPLPGGIGISISLP